MLRIVEILSAPLSEEQLTPPLILTLPFEMRQKSRFKAVLDNGIEVGLFLSRGQVMRSGDCLRTEDGQIIHVTAANEEVSTVRHEDMFEIARCAYHLGNRHVSLQIGRGWLRYKHDHVLDEMVSGLGLEVCFELAPFEPEGGAYGGHSHAHSHSHSQSHTDKLTDGHSHSHSHSNNHTHAESHSHTHTHVEIHED